MKVVLIFFRAECSLKIRIYLINLDESSLDFVFREECILKNQIIFISILADIADLGNDIGNFIF